MNPLPPQAYTKETLHKAYQWLLHQSASIKEMAANQDILVSLYLKAQRNGEASLEAPSIQNFKQELKSLAHMMGDFQSPTAPAATAAATPVSVAVASAIPNHPSASNAILSQLDSASISAINDVKASLNLSSDLEAIRALIALGNKQFKKIHQ